MTFTTLYSIFSNKCCDIYLSDVRVSVWSDFQICLLKFDEFFWIWKSYLLRFPCILRVWKYVSSKVCISNSNLTVSIIFSKVTKSPLQEKLILIFKENIMLWGLVQEIKSKNLNVLQRSFLPRPERRQYQLLSFPINLNIPYLPTLPHNILGKIIISYNVQHIHSLD